MGATVMNSEYISDPGSFEILRLRSALKVAPYLHEDSSQSDYEKFKYAFDIIAGNKKYIAKFANSEIGKLYVSYLNYLNWSVGPAQASEWFCDQTIPGDQGKEIVEILITAAFVNLLFAPDITVLVCSKALNRYFILARIHLKVGRKLSCFNRLKSKLISIYYARQNALRLRVNVKEPVEDLRECVEQVLDVLYHPFILKKRDPLLLRIFRVWGDALAEKEEYWTAIEVYNGAEKLVDAGISLLEEPDDRLFVERVKSIIGKYKASLLAFMFNFSVLRGSRYPLSVLDEPVVSFESSVKYYREELLPLAIDRLGEDSLLVDRIRSLQSETLHQLGRLDEALEVELSIVDKVRDKFGEKTVRYATELSKLGEIYVSRRDRDNAIDTLTKSVSVLSKLVSQQNPIRIRHERYLNGILDPVFFDALTDKRKSLTKDFTPQAYMAALIEDKMGLDRAANGLLQNRIEFILREFKCLFEREPELSKTVMDEWAPEFEGLTLSNCLESFLAHGAPVEGLLKEALALENKVFPIHSCLVSSKRAGYRTLPKGSTPFDGFNAIFLNTKLNSYRVLPKPHDRSRRLIDRFYNLEINENNMDMVGEDGRINDFTFFAHMISVTEGKYEIRRRLTRTRAYLG